MNVRKQGCKNKEAPLQAVAALSDPSEICISQLGFSLLKREELDPLAFSWLLWEMIYFDPAGMHGAK